MTYEENVRKIAEILARIHYANAITSLYPAETWEGNPLPAKEWAISNKMDEARAMIAEIAKEVKGVLFLVLDHNIFNKGAYPDKYLIERGLIPAQEPFHCNNKVTDKGICTTQCDRCKVSDYHFQ